MKIFSASEVVVKFPPTEGETEKEQFTIEGELNPDGKMTDEMRRDIIEKMMGALQARHPEESVEGLRAQIDGILEHLLPPGESLIQASGLSLSRLLSRCTAMLDGTVGSCIGIARAMHLKSESNGPHVFALGGVQVLVRDAISDLTRAQDILMDVLKCDAGKSEPEPDESPPAPLDKRWS